MIYANRWYAARWGTLVATAGLLLTSATLRAAPPEEVAPPEPPARYWVRLRHKGGVRFDPATYFSPPAQARRQRQHLPAADSTDLPVRPD